MGNEIKASQYPAQTEVHAYSKGAPAADFPVTVKAPIITDAMTEEGVQPLLDFVASLQAHSNVAIAETEADRLQPYFSALSVYLTQAFKEVYPSVKRERRFWKKRITEKDLEQAKLCQSEALSANRHAYSAAREENLSEEERIRRENHAKQTSMELDHAIEAREKIEEQLRLEGVANLQKLASPGELSGLFNAMASYTRNTFISDVVIIPANIKKDGPAVHLFEAEPFNKDFSTGDYDFNFGFLQIFEGGDRKKVPGWHVLTPGKDSREESQCSTTIPTFSIDAQMMQEIAPYQSEALLRSLQIVLTALNHDMVHHFQSPAIVDTLAHKFTSNGYVDENNPVYVWYAYNLATGIFSSHLEQWSQLNHGKVFMAEGNEEMVGAINTAIHHFFNELERIGKALPKEKAYEVIDYFGTAMAQTLTRTFPLNHDVMTHCLDRLQESFPLSEKELIEKTLINVADMFHPGGNSLEELRKAIEKSFDFTEIIAGYRNQDCDILPDDDNNVSYKSLKLLQLIEMSPGDLSAHIPQSVTPTIKELRAKVDRVSVELIEAVAKTTGYSPK